jgi:hypothetical protein
MGEIETSGFKAWWPMKEFQGRTKDGANVVTKGFRNMVNGEFHAPEKGFDGEPPRPSGDLSNVRHVSETYRENYDRIDWGVKGEPNG